MESIHRPRGQNPDAGLATESPLLQTLSSQHQPDMTNFVLAGQPEVSVTRTGINAFISNLEEKFDLPHQTQGSAEAKWASSITL